MTPLPATNLSVTVSQTYAATPAAAFAAWTDPASLEKWFGPPGYRARVLAHDLRPGGTWRFQMISDAGDIYHHFGTYTDIAPPHRLAFTWASEEQVAGWRDTAGNPTQVTVTFTPAGTGVTVTVTHENLTTETARTALTHGWGDGLTKLTTYLAEHPAHA